ncbi:MAG: InlB B-repeat-containing protein [Alphaproteobacteria bacterium]
MKRIFLTSGLVLCMACPAFATDVAGFTSSQTGTVSNGCDYGDLETFTGPTQLKAIWTADGYTLKYLPNTPATTAQGQSNTVTGLPSDPVAVTYDSSHTVATPSLTGYTFNGWTASTDIGTATGPANNGLTYYAGSTIANYKGVGDQTMTASWTANRYDVTYANSGGSQTDTHQGDAIYDANYVALDIAATTIETPAGHTFIGWSETVNPTVTRGAANGTTPVNTGTVDGGEWTGETPWRIADNNKKVYAAFLANQYNITYKCTGGEPDGNTGNVNGIATGDAPADTLVTYGQSYELASNTCRLQGYKFAGWECEGLTGNTANDSGYYNAGVSTGTFTNTANVACVAKWTPGTITDIQWDADGGSYTGTPSTSCTYDDEIVLPTNPQKTGYTFGGWEVVGHNPSQPSQQ